MRLIPTALTQDGWPVGTHVNATDDGVSEPTVPENSGTRHPEMVVEESGNPTYATKPLIKVPESSSELSGEESATGISKTRGHQRQPEPGGSTAAMSTSLSNAKEHTPQMGTSSSQAVSGMAGTSTAVDSSYADTVGAAPLSANNPEGDKSMPRSDSPIPTGNTDEAVLSTTEETVNSLNSETDGQPDDTEEDAALLKERLSLGVDIFLRHTHAPLGHSASTVTIPPSTPRQDIDEPLSQEDPATPSPEPVTSSDTGILDQDSSLETDPDSPKLASMTSEPRSDNTKERTPVATPSAIEEDIKMLNLRLEIGLGAHIDVHPSPGLMKHTISNQTIPSATPSSDNLSEDMVLISDGPISSNLMDSKGMEEEPLTASVTSDDVLGHSSPPVTPTSTRASSEAQRCDVPQGSSDDASIDAEEPQATPMAKRVHLADYNLERLNEGPTIIDMRSGLPLLDLPEPSEADITSNYRIQMDRSTSMMPEPPTSPRLELDIEQMEVRTPTTVATPAEYLFADRARQKVTPGNNSLDFVDDARSERSVATSVAPIAPNSPRFITPLLTPPSDADGFSFYEAGRAPLLKTSSHRSLTGAVRESSVANNGTQEYAPELRDALTTSFRQESDTPPDATAEQNQSVLAPLAPVDEEGTHMSPIQNSTVRARPGHNLSPSAWSIHRASGWFNSPPEKVPGRASMEVAEGEFSRPISRIRSGEYPPDTRGTASSPSKNDPNRCIIM